MTVFSFALRTHASEFEFTMWKSVLSYANFKLYKLFSKISLAKKFDGTLPGNVKLLVHFLSEDLQEKETESSRNVMAHGDAREGKWRGNRRVEWVASTLHTTSEHVVSNITTADSHNSAANSRLNWRPCRFKWTRPFRLKTKSVYCACVITYETQST